MNTGLDAIKHGFRPATLVANVAVLACLANTLPAYVAAGDAAPTPGQVVANGMVPNEATKATMLVRLHELYGNANMVDQIGVGNVMSPPGRSANVQEILSPVIKQVNRGQLNIDGTWVSLHGNVGNGAQRQQLTGNVATALGQSYMIKNELRMAAMSEQGLLDQTLANCIIRFETGSATLISEGRATLDEMIAMLPRLNGRKVGVVGHTDNPGDHVLSLNLDQAHAETVKDHPIAKGTR